MQRAVLAFTMLLAIALPCHAQDDKAKPNTLTPKEIADGWILLFDGETTFGWIVEGARVSNDVLDIGGKTAGFANLATTFNEFELRYEYRNEGKNPARFERIRPGGAVDAWRFFDNAPANPMLWATQAVHMRVDSTKGEFSYRQDDTSYTGEKRERGGGGFSGTIRTYVTFKFEAPEGTLLRLRNIKLRPLNTKSIFNGKDLAGWKEFPGKKSKFAVNDKGELNVKDGPGDLQTVGKYKDFVLQLECISNGKHLNSGIFFRCRDNEYQNGYEAQIRNQFTAEPTQKYLIEEYDPKTNKLTAKKEITSTAFDYGTGAIYRRVPARKAMSKDGEWFGMTIVAHGNHLATWVNGVQVTDWYDHRPKSDNARTGCKLEAGHISIQGHDPTTDLSFRNFRIAELPAGK